jgi:hypothetical protein
MSFHRLRLPVSTRHAFALAFDLAVRRDLLQSIAIPLLLQSPWILALGALPPLSDTDRTVQVFSVWFVAQLGAFLIWLIVSAMLRFRARSVFNTPPHVPPAPPTECYARGLKRVPWLLVTEIVRNVSIVFATFFFVVPAVFLGFRLSFATEAVVLDEAHLASAFQRSFRLTEGRFERWLEMIAVSVVLVFAAVFTGALLSVVFPSPGINMWVAFTQLLIAAMMPIIQYAWTFFYLRLVEIDHPSVTEAPPAYAAVPEGAPAYMAPAADAPLAMAAEESATESAEFAATVEPTNAPHPFAEPTPASTYTSEPPAREPGAPLA